MNKVKGTKLRRMIADCLMYFPKNERGFYGREEVIVELGEHCTTCRLALSDLISNYKEYNLNEIFITGYNLEDYDGYADNTVSVYAVRKQNDEEYFNSLADYLCPSQHQLEKYKQYLHLKKEFEGK